MNNLKRRKSLDLRTEWIQHCPNKTPINTKLKEEKYRRKKSFKVRVQVKAILKVQLAKVL